MLILGTLTHLSIAQAPQATPQPQTLPQSAQPTGPKPLPAFYRNIIFLDPAHGGPDTGAHLANNALEKDVVLSFSARLRTVLGAAGFTVLSTRDTDPAALLTSDQRAGIANHARPLACLLLHATSSGSGVHIVTSSLTPPEEATIRSALPWQTAQTNTVPQSLKLADELSSALQNAKLPAVRLRASVPPIDSLTCAAAAIELSPHSPSGAQATPVTDSSYQQQVVEAIAAALTSYRERYAPAPMPSQPASPSLPVAPRGAAR